MSKKFEFARFDISVKPMNPHDDYEPYLEAEGDWVKAQDALNREAVNADRIRVLEIQLKEAKAHAK